MQANPKLPILIEHLQSVTVRSVQTAKVWPHLCRIKMLLKENLSNHMMHIFQLLHNLVFQYLIVNVQLDYGKISLLKRSVKDPHGRSRSKFV